MREKTGRFMGRLLATDRDLDAGVVAQIEAEEKREHAAALELLESREFPVSVCVQAWLLDNDRDAKWLEEHWGEDARRALLDASPVRAATVMRVARRLNWEWDWPCDELLSALAEGLSLLTFGSMFRTAEMERARVKAALARHGATA